MGVEAGGVEGGGYPLSAGRLETGGFKCALCGVKLGLTPAFFAQESSCGYGAHSPIIKKRVWGTATNILLEIFVNKVKIVSLRSVLRVGAMPLKRFF